MKAISRVSGPVVILAFVGVSITTCSRASVQGGTGGGGITAAGRTSHLDMYLRDPAMPLGASVLVELANGPALSAARLDSARSRLRTDGFEYGSKYANDVLKALSGALVSPVSLDEQQLIVADESELAFGPKVSLVVPSTISGVSDGSLKNGLVWLATILNWEDSEYKPLNIAAKSHKCLYVGRDDSWRITAWHFDSDGSVGCLLGSLSLDVVKNKPNAQELDGFALKPGDVDSKFDKDELPGAARWEWTKKDTQVIGVRCGSRWCQLAPKGTQESDLEQVPPDLGEPSKEERSRARIKGWFDFQVLADMGSDGKLVPSGILARIQPKKKSDMESAGSDKWPTVAKIILWQRITGAQLPAKYEKKKLILGDNNLQMCTGDYASVCKGTGPEPVPQTPCDKTYPKVWGRFVNVTGVGPIFRVCVADDDNSQKSPWATRWHWDPKDEGMWVRCLNGCCQPKF